MEFSTLNGYKVKDKKASRFYDDVESMKNDYTLKDGMHVKTKGYYFVNDGGCAEYHITDTASETEFQEELNNGLYATLIINNTINVKQLGAYGDDINDDTNVLLKAITLSNNIDIPVYIPEGIYKTSDTLTFINDLYMNGTIKYYGNNTCLVIGNNNDSVKEKHYEINIDKNEEYENSKGVQFINNVSSNIIIKKIKNFYYGVEFKGNNSKGFAYNNVKIEVITGFKEAITLNNDNSGWCNENYFTGGRIYNDSTATYKDNELAFRITSAGTYRNNNNNFNNFSFENCKEGIIIDYGTYNRFTNLRSENVVTLVQYKNNSDYNVVTVGDGTSTYTEQAPNIVNTPNSALNSNYNKSIYDSGQINNNAASTNSRLSIANVYSIYENSLVSNSAGSSFTDGKISLRNAAVIGSMINLDSTDKTIMFERIGDDCRVAIFCYNSQNQFIDEEPISAGGSSFSKYSSNSQVGSVPYYRTGNDNTTTYVIKLPESTHHAFIGVQSSNGGTNIERIRIFCKNSSKSYSVGFDNEKFPILNSIPTSSGYIGQIVLSSDTSIKGWIYDGTTWNVL